MKKKFIPLFLAIISLTALFVGCKKQEEATLPISELRVNLYQGKTDTTTINASYGYRETPYHADGKISEKTYALTFSCKEHLDDEISYYISFDYNGKNYKAVFQLDHAKNLLKATVPIENFSENTFDITFSHGSENEKITMNSILPENTLSAEDAIKKLREKQPSLLESMKNSEGEFEGEIYQRVIVKNGKSYWYIGLADSAGKIKAFLLDGVSGEPLAVREIF